MSQLLDDLKASRQALADRVWIKGHYFLPGTGPEVYDTSGCCALGAIRLGTGVVDVATGRMDLDIEGVAFDREQRYRRVVRRVAESAGGHFNASISLFNDKIAETKEEVLALFDAAIALAAEEEEAK